MSNILLLSGSPTASSRSVALLDYASAALVKRNFTITRVSVRDFSAEDLIQARYDSPGFDRFKAQIAEATGLIVTTPVYKASYSGSLKALLDILPQTALRGKTILPIATGGTLAHLLAIDYALKPVLSVLGASDIHQGVFVVDTHFKAAGSGFTLDAELQQRFDESLERFAATVRATRSVPLPVSGLQAVS